MRLVLREKAPPLCWGLPDSPMRELCALCHGPLPRVPLIIWKDNYAASLCDQCVENFVVVEP
jgi:hypothetical protein